MSHHTWLCNHVVTKEWKDGMDQLLCRGLSVNLCCWLSERWQEGWRWGRKYYLVRSMWRCATQNSFQLRALCYTRMTGLSWQMHLRFEFFQNGFWTTPEQVRGLRHGQILPNMRVSPKPFCSELPWVWTLLGPCCGQIPPPNLSLSFSFDTIFPQWASGT